MRVFIKTLAISLLGGYLFYILGLPIPWMLGALTFVLIFKHIFSQKIYWHYSLREAAQIIMGFVMGSAIVADNCLKIISLIPGMFLSTIFIITFTLIVGSILPHYISISYSTSILGSIPGGISQMVLLCDEINEAEISIVTFMQAIRLITVIFIVPFIVLHSSKQIILPSLNIQTISLNFLLSDKFYLLLFYIIIAYIGGLIAKRIRIPTPYLMGAMLSISIASLIGLNVPIMPSLFVRAAQISFGVYLGVSIDIKKLEVWRRILPITLISTLAVITISLLGGYFLTKFYSMDLLTGFLSTAPGGMSEMAITAISVNADLSTVTTYQLFRILFINLVTIPFLRWMLKRQRLDVKNDSNRNIFLSFKTRIKREGGIRN